MNIKPKDQQLLEEAYSNVVKKMMAGANNPDWSPERGLTSGHGFKGLSEPKGGWPDREGKKKSAPKQKSKSFEKAKEEELDVEGDPVGSYQSIAEPQPEEDHSASMMFISNAELEKVFHADEALFDKLFKDSEGATEESNGIIFRYLAPRIKEKMEQLIQSAIA